MTKFEIINDKWIKQEKGGQYKFEALRIDSIVYLSIQIEGYVITLGTSNPDKFLSIWYIENEKEQYESDLEYLEKLLFYRS
jgi:hypothetical protein